MKIDSTAYLVWPSWAKQEEQKAYKLMKLYSILLNEKLVKTEIKKEIKYFLKLNKKTKHNKIYGIKWRQFIKIPFNI